MLSPGILAQEPGLPEGTPGPLPQPTYPVGESGYKTLQITGLNNRWNLGDTYGLLKNPEGRLWETFTFVSSGTHEFRFVANRTWQVWWGLDPAEPPSGLSGITKRQGGNLKVTIPAGTQYRIRFDETDGSYSFTPAGGAIPPVARAGEDQRVAPGTIVQFNARDSYDPDGTIASYAWSNGLSGMQATMRYDLEGVYEVVLTVTDDSGNTAEDSLTITVENQVSLDRDFRSETIYSVLTTRFYNGNEDNDFYCRERVAKGDPHWRGDFRGLIDRLDYIRNLGFTAILLSPPVENRGGLDFDGFFAYDWDTVDPRLESAGASFTDLITAAHDRGIRVIQSVVLNHSCNYGIRGKVFVDRLPHKFYRAAGMKVPWPYVFNLGNYKHPFREDNDNRLAPDWFKDLLISDPWGKGPLTDQKTGTVLPKEGYDSERFFGTDEKTLDSQWYHRNGWVQSTDEVTVANVQGMHWGKNMLDLATENWLVKNYINQAVNRYLDWGVDAVVIEDAVFTSRSELPSFYSIWKEHKPGLFVGANVPPFGTGLGMLGPDKLPSELTPWWYSRTGTDPNNPDSGGASGIGVLDYVLQDQLYSCIASGAFGGIATTITWDWIYGDPTFLITFFQNQTRGHGPDHMSRFGGESWKAAIAYNLLWTMRGIPCLWFGEEVEFQKGAPIGFPNSNSTLAQTGLAYFGDKLTDSQLPMTQSNAIHQHLKRLNFIRSRIPALQMGTVSNGKEWDNGISFVRDFKNGTSYVVVGLSTGADQEITVERVRPGNYRDAVTGSQIQVATGSPDISFTVKSNSAGIWELNGTGKIGVDGPFLR